MEREDEAANRIGQTTVEPDVAFQAANRIGQTTVEAAVAGQDAIQIGQMGQRPRQMAN
jgi:hypothetical protein